MIGTFNGIFAEAWDRIERRFRERAAASGLTLTRGTGEHLNAPVPRVTVVDAEGRGASCVVTDFAVSGLDHWELVRLADARWESMMAALSANAPGNGCHRRPGVTDAVEILTKMAGVQDEFADPNVYRHISDADRTMFSHAAAMLRLAAGRIARVTEGVT